MTGPPAALFLGSLLAAVAGSQASKKQKRDADARIWRCCRQTHKRYEGAARPARPNKITVLLYLKTCPDSEPNPLSNAKLCRLKFERAADLESSFFSANDFASCAPNQVDPKLLASLRPGTAGESHACVSPDARDFYFIEARVAWVPS